MNISSTQSLGGVVDTAPSDHRPTQMVIDIPPAHHRLPYFERLRAAICEGADALPCVLTLDGARYPGRVALDAVLTGEVEMAWVNASHLEVIAPSLALINQPFETDDTGMGRPGRAGALVDAVDQELQGSGVRVLGVMRGADQLLVYQSGVITDVEEMAGLRVRVAGPGVYPQLMQALGALPVEIPIPAIQNAFDTHQLDCVFTSPGGWKTQVFSTAKQATWVPGLMFINYMLVVNANWLSSRSANQRKRLRHLADEQVTGAWDSMRRDDERLLEAMCAEGAKIHVVSDSAKWRDRIMNMKTALTERFGQLGHAPSSTVNS